MGKSRDLPLEPKTSVINFGAWLRRERERRGLNFVQLAEMVGLHPTTLSKIERDNLDVRMSTFLALCLAFERRPSRVIRDLAE